MLLTLEQYDTILESVREGTDADGYAFDEMAVAKAIRALYNADVCLVLPSPAWTALERDFYRRIAVDFPKSVVRLKSGIAVPIADYRETHIGR